MIDAEEEVGGHSVCDWAEADTGPAHAAVILDGGYATQTLPSFCTALRGHLLLPRQRRERASGTSIRGWSAALPSTRSRR